MPGNSFFGPLPVLTAPQKDLAGALQQHVQKLANEIGPRGIYLSSFSDSLKKAEEYVAATFTSFGFAVRTQEFNVDGKPVRNIEVEILGAELPQEILIIGAHYDSCGTTPGANDNGSGISALLEMAKKFSARKPRRTIRFVAFVNEEPPYFQTDNMGSLVYARRCREKNENIVGMISLETLAYYSEEEGSQKYPFPFSLFYPSRGNFIAFVGNMASRSFSRRCIRVFREEARFPSEGVAAPEKIPGIGWSDHWSFWQFDYPAIMVTDTAYFRDPAYHQEFDTAGRLDCQGLARVVEGLCFVVQDLALAAD